jgi:hypothetical protein
VLRGEEAVSKGKREEGEIKLDEMGRDREQITWRE